MRAPLHTLLALCLLCLSACTALSAEKPKVTITSVSLGSVGFSGITGEMGMTIFNPNSFGLPLSKVEWTLHVGNASAASGSFEASETIPAKASAPVVGRIHIGTSQAIGVGSELAAGARSYTLQARFTFEARLGSLTVDVAHTGQLL